MEPRFRSRPVSRKVPLETQISTLSDVDAVLDWLTAGLPRFKKATSE